MDEKRRRTKDESACIQWKNSGVPDGLSKACAKRKRKPGCKILLAAVCNTDKEVLAGYKPDFTGVMGHEFVGIVEASDRPELIGKTGGR